MERGRPRPRLENKKRAPFLAPFLFVGKSKRAPLDRRPWGGCYELAPSGVLEQSISNLVPPPPRISGGPATSATSMVVTHLAVVADRIGRSYSPCGGREERDLVESFKESCGHVPHGMYQSKQSPSGFIATRRPSLSLCCMVNRIRFLVVIAIQKISHHSEFKRRAALEIAVLHFSLFGAD